MMLANPGLVAKRKHETWNLEESANRRKIVITEEYIKYAN